MCLKHAPHAFKHGLVAELYLAASRSGLFLSIVAEDKAIYSISANEPVSAIKPPSIKGVSVFGGLQINGSRIGGSCDMQDELYFKHLGKRLNCS